MAFELKPDYEQVKKRYEAFWENEIIDRPPVRMTFPVENPKPSPTKTYDSEAARWKDVEFRAEQQAVALENTIHYADALPITWPNLGPEIFSAWCGCGYHFGETTTWSDPCIHDWERDAPMAVLDMDHELFRLMDRFTDRLIERGNGRFIVGLTDFHPGGDHLAALRDPEQLAFDMIENIDWIKKKLADSYSDYFTAYDHFYHKLKDAGMPITSWTPLIHDGSYYIPSNDFSCMISEEMFREVFLPGLIEECRRLERSIYHLDGPGALRHLDALLDIAELDAVQWVAGAGNEGFTRWIDVYKKIQAGGKGIQILGLRLEELPILFENLKPEGIFITNIGGIDSKETADAVLKRLERWE
jgi:hypothetical protein